MKPYERLYVEPIALYEFSDRDCEIKQLARAQEIANLAREVNCMIIHLEALGKLVLKQEKEIKELKQLHTEGALQ